MSHKPYIVAGLVFTAAAVGVTAIYLPNYTEKSYKHSENVPNSTNLMGGATNEKGQTGGGSRGSMWGNIEKERIKEEAKQSSTKTDKGAWSFMNGYVHFCHANFFHAIVYLLQIGMAGLYIYLLVSLVVRRLTKSSLLHCEFFQTLRILITMFCL